MITVEIPLRVYNQVRRTKGALSGNNFVVIAHNKISDERVHFLTDGTELYFCDGQTIVGSPVVLTNGGYIPDWTIKLKIGNMVYRLEKE